MHPWWSLVARKPFLMRRVSSTITVLMGGQPSGMQCNFGQKRCMLCDILSTDKPDHVLFECAELEEKRCLLWPQVIVCMPPGMTIDMECYNNARKTQYLISCLHSSFINEWSLLYEKVADFVHSMYAHRKRKYDAMQE